MNVDLARRAVKCKGWRWLPGSLDNLGYRIINHHSGDRFNLCRWTEYVDGSDMEVSSHVPWLPDLDDPATKGCLLQLIREGLHDQTVYVHPYGSGWRWRTNYRDSRLIYRSEVEALVAALEALDTAPR